MNAPTREDLREHGYKMSSNANADNVSACASIVRIAYLNKCVSDEIINNSESSGMIGRAWRALTYLCYCQDVDFGTRTGGENKRFEYGTKPQDYKRLKTFAAIALKELTETYPIKSDFDDVCNIYFKNQFYY